MIRHTRNYPHIHFQQQGVALVVSLILLVVITLLSVTAMRSANLDTKITINHQHKQLAFQAAENALTKFTSLNIDDPAMDTVQIPGNVDDDPETTPTWYQQTGSSNTPDLAADLTIDYLEKTAPGKIMSSGNETGSMLIYQVEAAGTVPNTNARVRNRMQVALFRQQ